MRTITLDDLKISREQRNLLWPWRENFWPFYDIAIMLTFGWRIVPAGDFLAHWLQKDKETLAIDKIPSFHNSLDACVALREFMSPDQMNQFASELETIVREEGDDRYPKWRKVNPSHIIDVLLISAEPDQHCRAFLRIMHLR